MPELYEIATLIERKALGLGFSACGFSTSVQLTELEPDFRNWLSMGNAGEMNYLARNVEIRLDPGKLVDGAKTIISLAAGYYSDLPDHIPGNPRISRYALGDDYHRVVKSLGHELLGWINNEFGPANGRVFTDSAPILEREWCRRAGMGWIGKNGCLIIPQQGSWFFLAEIVLDIEIPSREKVVQNRCGNCTRCIEACPTQCILPNRTLDARRCISYLTIELKDSIPEELRPLMQDWIFGCDICQQVCPWNRFSLPADSAFEPKIPLPVLTSDLILTSVEFNQRFKKSPLKRAKRRGYLRNLAVANGNNGNENDIPILEQAAQDDEPMVSEHAKWAIQEIKRKK